MTRVALPTPAEWRRRTWYGRLVLPLEVVALFVVGLPTLLGCLLLRIPTAYRRARERLGVVTPEVYHDGE